MMLYRYCTAALAGPWRDTPREALADALNAGQARYDLSGKNIELVVGRIEKQGEIEQSARGAA